MTINDDEEEGLTGRGWPALLAQWLAHSGGVLYSQTHVHHNTSSVSRFRLNTHTDQHRLDLMGGGGSAFNHDSR